MEPEASYRELVTEICPAPIESEEHYEKVAVQLEALSVVDDTAETPDPGREQMIALLTTLLGAWDDERHPDPDLTPAQMFALTLESRNLSKSELARAIGITQQELNGLDTGDRDFSIRVAQLVSGYFGHPVSLYLKTSSSPD